MGPTEQTVAGRKVKPSDNVMGEVERLNARLSSTFATLNDLRDRVSGTRPPSAGENAAVETAFSIGGFVGSVGQSLERAHRMLTEIDEAIAAVGDVI